MRDAHIPATETEVIEWEDSTTVQAGFIVNAKVAGLLIGKKGANIKQLKSESGINLINFSDLKDPALRAALGGQLMVMKGTTEQIGKAAEMAGELILGSGLIESDTIVDFPMLIPEDQVRKVIGKAGKHIKAKQKETGSKMTFSSQEESVYGETVLLVKGPPVSVARGIVQVLRGLPVEAWRTERPLFRAAFGKDLYERGGPMRGGRGGDRGPPMRGPPMRGPPMRGPPAPYYDDYPRYEEPYPPKRRKQAPLPYGMPEPSFAADLLIRCGFVMTGKEASILLGKGGATVKRLTQQSGCKKISFGKGDLPDTGGLQLMVLKGTLDAVVVGTARACAVLARANKMGNMGLEDGVVEMNLVVQAVEVGKLIGQQGAHIREMESYSGAKMIFEKTGQVLKDEQIMKIKGTPQDVGEAVRISLGGMQLESFSAERPLFEAAKMGRAEGASYDFGPPQGGGRQGGGGGYLGTPPSRGPDYYPPRRDYYDHPGPRDGPRDYGPPPTSYPGGYGGGYGPRDGGIDEMLLQQQDLERALATQKQKLQSAMQARPPVPQKRPRDSQW